MLVAGNLAAKDETGLESVAVERVLFLLQAADFAEIVRGFSDRVDGIEVDGGVLADVFLHLRNCGLRGSQVAGSHHHKLPCWTEVEAEHLAVGADLVDTGIGA